MARFFDSCPLCGGTNVPQLYEARDPHFGIPGVHRIVRCEQCGLVFTNPMRLDEELMRMYPSDYYAYHDPPKGNRLKPFLKEAFGYWQGVRDPDFRRSGVFLDLGCGSGTHMKRMRDLGWEVYGVEVNASAASRGVSNGLQIFCGKLQEAKFPTESFDYIRASHSLEHMTDPHDVLEEIWRILKPAGKLLIAVPNIESFGAQLFKQYWWHLCPPLHPFSYSARTLTLLLKKHGFDASEIAFNSDYVGLLGSLQIWLNRKNGRQSWEGALFNSRPLRVLSSWVQKLGDFLRRGDMIELVAVARLEASRDAQKCSLDQNAVGNSTQSRVAIQK